MALGKKEVLPGGDPFSPPPPRPRAPSLPPTPFCWALVAAAVIVFAAGLRDEAVFEAGVLSGPRLAAGEWWRLLSWVFTHGGPLHLFFNLSAVWTLGRMLEQGLGTWRFLQGSIAGALGAALFVLLFDYEARTVGMSGVILSWLGLALPVSNRAARRQLGVWLLQVAVVSLLPGVSWSGHFGGLVAGLPAGLALRRGRDAFSTALPVWLFVLGGLVVLAGQGRFR